MSSRKVASVFHRLFRKGRGGEEGAGGAGGSQGSGSPARRLIRSHHAVQPSSPSQGHVFSKKKSSSNSSSGSVAADASKVQKSVRSKRLMKELQDIQKTQQKKDPPFTVDLINDNLYEWHIRLYSIDKESELAADMAELGIRHISLQMSFPENFPFVPPFMRVISPKIEKGFVMEGGAICMELLTPRGWASAYTVEAIIMQFAASLVKGQGRISRKTKSTSSKEFNKRVAEESFRSLVKTHEKYGWVTPPLSDG